MHSSISLANTRKHVSSITTLIQKKHQFSRIRLFVTPWTTAHQASLSLTNSRGLPKLMSIELVMPSSHLILCHPLLFLPPIPSSIKVVCNESTLRMRWPKYWSFSFSIIPSKEIPVHSEGDQPWDFFGRKVMTNLSSVQFIRLVVSDSLRPHEL